MKLRFDRPFFKEFTLQVDAKQFGAVPALLGKLLKAGYHAGLPVGTWYPALADCLSLAVTEKRTKAEIDGLMVSMQ